MQAFNDRTLGASKFALSALCTAMAVAGCGGGGGSDGASGGGSATTLYIGYYAEDPVNNPEDPTIGAVMFTAPSGDGSFSGQMPFSYIGCAPGIDTGAISGTRAGDSLNGTWSGTLDGTPAGGSFSGGYQAADNSFSGTFRNAAGKVSVSGCNYFIAASGTFKVWAATSQPASFTLSVTAGTSPTLSWPSQGAGVTYDVRMFDHACLQANPTNAACLKGQAATVSLSAAYPAMFAGAAPLPAGIEHLAVVTASNLKLNSFVGFTSQRFTPN